GVGAIVHGGSPSGFYGQRCADIPHAGGAPSQDTWLPVYFSLKCCGLRQSAVVAGHRIASDRTVVSLWLSQAAVRVSRRGIRARLPDAGTRLTNLFRLRARTSAAGHLGHLRTGAEIQLPPTARHGQGKP